MFILLVFNIFGLFGFFCFVVFFLLLGGFGFFGFFFIFTCFFAFDAVLGAEEKHSLQISSTLQPPEYLCSSCRTQEHLPITGTPDSHRPSSTQITQFTMSLHYYFLFYYFVTVLCYYFNILLFCYSISIFYFSYCYCWFNFIVGFLCHNFPKTRSRTSPEEAMMMIRGLKQICYEDRLRKLELSRQGREGSVRHYTFCQCLKGRQESWRGASDESMEGQDKKELFWTKKEED